MASDQLLSQCKETLALSVIEPFMESQPQVEIQFNLLELLENEQFSETSWYETVATIEKEKFVEEYLCLLKHFKVVKCDETFSDLDVYFQRLQYMKWSLTDIQTSIDNLMNNYLMKMPDHPNFRRKKSIAHLKKNYPKIAKWNAIYSVPVKITRTSEHSNKKDTASFVSVKVSRNVKHKAITRSATCLKKKCEMKIVSCKRPQRKKCTFCIRLRLLFL